MAAVERIAGRVGMVPVRVSQLLGNGSRPERR
jgi:hypothetical protein